jgi:flagellar biosynthesis anti-sigma factor FlgM
MSHHLSLLKFPLEERDFFPRAYYIKKIQKVLEETPEIRAEKVKRLKKEIAAGTYKVESEKIAEKMINESLLDLIL